VGRPLVPPARLLRKAVSFTYQDGVHVCWLPEQAINAQHQRAGRRDFPAFPYTPYGIQTDFMRSLYDTLEAGGIGLFESPTGDLGRTPLSQKLVALPEAKAASLCMTIASDS